MDRVELPKARFKKYKTPRKTPRGFLSGAGLFLGAAWVGRTRRYLVEDFGLLHSPTGTFDSDDRGMMNQAIDQSRSDHRIA